MATPRVLLDTNIIISGLVFTKGNEHRILRLVEDGDISLVLPEPVLIETREILRRKFLGFEGLFEIFLDAIEFEFLSLDAILAPISRYSEIVRDEKDVAIFASVVISHPDYFITGDRGLRFDLSNDAGIRRKVKVCSSREFLYDFGKD